MSQIKKYSTKVQMQHMTELLGWIPVSLWAEHKYVCVYGKSRFFI